MFDIDDGRSAAADDVDAKRPWETPRLTELAIGVTQQSKLPADAEAITYYAVIGPAS